MIDIIILIKIRIVIDFTRNIVSIRILINLIRKIWFVHFQSEIFFSARTADSSSFLSHAETISRILTCFGKRCRRSIARSNSSTSNYEVEIGSAIVSPRESAQDAFDTVGLIFLAFPRKPGAGRSPYLWPRKINEPRGALWRRPSSKRRLWIIPFSRDNFQPFNRANNWLYAFSSAIKSAFSTECRQGNIM